MFTAQRLGIAPEECLVFEDALAGVLAAKRAGMSCVACPDPRLDPSIFTNETPWLLPNNLDSFNFDDWTWQ